MTGPHPSTLGPVTTRALVLGGGGITGIAWELGLLHGLAGAGVDLGTADLVVGTSAGSVVGAQLRSDVALAELYEHQLRPAGDEPTFRLSPLAMARMVPPFLLPGTTEQKRARLGRAAQRRHPGDGSERVAVIRESVPWEQWPEGDLSVTAVDADSGEFTVFDRHSGVDLVHAVASSCAVPMVWPAVEVAGRRYLDGGFRSPANVDVATGHDAVVVVAPLPRSFSQASSIEAQLARTGCTRAAVVAPDAEALRAIGRNVLDPAHRAAAARTGLRQAAEVADQVRAAWA